MVVAGRFTRGSALGLGITLPIMALTRYAALISGDKLPYVWYSRALWYFLSSWLGIWLVASWLWAWTLWWKGYDWWLCTQVAVERVEEGR